MAVCVRQTPSEPLARPSGYVTSSRLGRRAVASSFGLAPNEATIDQRITDQ